MHDGAARRLVHNLKYRGLAAAAEVLAAPMAALLPEGTAAVAPVPRVLVRVARYGVDPAGELVLRIGALTGVPVLHRLVRPVWWPRRAGPAPAGRGTPGFRPRGAAVPGTVLIDDVITTGATLAAAAEVLPEVRWAVTATVAPSLGDRRRYDDGVAHFGPVERRSVRVAETAADEIP